MTNQLQKWIRHPKNRGGVPMGPKGAKIWSGDLEGPEKGHFGQLGGGIFWAQFWAVFGYLAFGTYWRPPKGYESGKTIPGVSRRHCQHHKPPQTWFFKVSVFFLEVEKLFARFFAFLPFWSPGPTAVSLPFPCCFRVWISFLGPNAGFVLIFLGRTPPSGFFRAKF